MMKNQRVKDYPNLFNEIDFGVLDFENIFEPNSLSDVLFIHYYDFYLVRNKDLLVRKINNRLITESIRLNKLFETTKYIYDPIDNYNMVEESTDKDTGTMKTSGTNSDTQSGTNKINYGSSSQNSGSDMLNNKDYQFPMNSTSKKQITESDNNTTYGRKETHSGEDSTSIDITNTQIKDTTDTKDYTLTHKMTRHGNIGVTTSQQMIESERKIIINMFDNLVKILNDYFFFDDSCLDEED